MHRVFIDRVHLLNRIAKAKGNFSHNIDSVPKVSHLWGQIDFL